jgi:hypothetical protein
MKGVPPAIQAQMQQAQQIIEQLGGALQEAQQVANDKQAEAQLKVGELQVKAQQAQTQAQKDQADAALAAAELAFEREKLATESALEEQRIELERIRIMTEAQRPAPVTTQPGVQPQIDSSAIMASLGENARIGYEMDLRAQEEQRLADAEQERQLAEIAAAAEEERVMVEFQESEKQKQIMALILQSLGDLQGSIANMSADLRAPKVIDVKRNPQTMLIEQATQRIQ